MTASRQATLSIVIVNWNSGGQLRECIESINSAIGSLDIQVCTVVVDNGSTDGSVDNLPEGATDIHLIKNLENRGFGAACNQGARKVSTDYLLFLNPDTITNSAAISDSVAFMERPDNQKIGICGIRLVDSFGNVSTSAANFPTLPVLAGSIFGMARFLPRLFPPHLIPDTGLSRDRVVDQVIGAFFLIRSSVFSLCGGFDERFFVYYEEVDLSLRVKHAGYSSYFLSGPSSFHKSGGCSDQVRAMRLFYSLRSRIQFGRKHYTGVGFFGLLTLTAVELPLRLARALYNMSYDDAANTMKAYSLLISRKSWGQK